MSRNVATYVICPTALLAHGLCHVLHQGHYQVSGSGPTFDALDVTPSTDPTVFILYLEDRAILPVPTLSTIHEHHPSARIILLGSTADHTNLIQALRHGAQAYLANTTSTDAILKALDVVMNEGVVIPAAMLPVIEKLICAAERDNARAISMPDIAPTQDLETLQILSQREALILDALINGDSNKVIARKMNIAEATVKAHVKAILRKIRVRNRTQAAIWAMNNGRLSNGAPLRLPLVEAASLPP